MLVTGAGGYIGRYVVSELLDRGCKVIAVSTHTNGIDPRAEILEYDIFSGSADIYNELSNPDICLHMAWKDGFVHNADTHMLNVSKHYEFIRNIIKGGLKHLAVMGSMHEVGYWEGAIDENTPTNPITQYGIAKDALRRSLMQLCKDNNVNYQWLRAYYIYGDDLRNNSIFSKIIRWEMEGKKTFPFNSGKHLYDFISVQELAKQVSLCILQNKINGIINCCTGKPKTLKDMVEFFLAENNFKIRPEYGAFPDRLYDSPGVWGNPEKIQTILKEAGE